MNNILDSLIYEQESATLQNAILSITYGGWNLISQRMSWNQLYRYLGERWFPCLGSVDIEKIQLRS